MLEHVGQALLDDAVGRQVQPAGQDGQVAVGAHVDLHSRLADLGHEVAEFPQARLGRQGQLAVALAEQAQQAAQLGHGLPPGLLDRFECFRGGVAARPEHPPLGRGLHHDDAQAVRDDIVQFAGDPGSLGGDCPGGQGVLLALQPFRAVFLARGTPPVRVHDPPEHEDQDVEHHGGQHVPGALPGHFPPDLPSEEQAAGNRGGYPEAPAVDPAGQREHGHQNRQPGLDGRLGLRAEHDQIPDSRGDGDHDRDRRRRPEPPAQRDRDQQQETRVRRHRPGERYVAPRRRKAPVLR